METFSPEETPCINEGAGSILGRELDEHVTVLRYLPELTSLEELENGWAAKNLNRVGGLAELARLARLLRRPGEWHRTISKNVDEVIRDHGFTEETPEVADKVGQNLSSKESWAAYAESVFQKTRRVLYGDLYHEGPPSKEDATQPGYLRRLEERREVFANLGSVEELKDFIFNMKRVLHFVLGSESTSAEFSNFSVSEEFRSSLLNAMKSRNWEEVESMVMPIAAALPRRAAIYEAFIFLASLLLSVVFQYLIGLVDKGGTKTHSSGSLEFRSRYISIVLFQGAYVWIKFREVAPPSHQRPSAGIYRKSKVNDLGVREYYGNFEPRFKPPGSDSYISVGSYEVEQEARDIYQILAFYYGKVDSGELPLLNSSTYLIPRMTEEEQRLGPEAKKDWAKQRAKVVLEEYNKAWVESLNDCPLDSEEVQVAEDISNHHPPDADAGCVGQPVQPDNQNDGFERPGVDTGEHDVADDSCSDRDAGGAGFGDEPPRQAQFQLHDLEENQVIYVNPGGAGVGDEPPRQAQFQRHGLEENQVMNVNRDDLSILRLVQELQRQQQLDQVRIQQLESRLQQQESQIQQHEARISGLVRDQQLQKLQMQHQVSRISELEGEVERDRSTEPARKRILCGTKPEA